MPWERSVEEQRAEFLALFNQEGANRRALCRAWGVSAKTAYKWQVRQAEAGSAGLADRLRVPRHSPLRSSEGIEAHVLALGALYPRWGARKLRCLFAQEGSVPGMEVPAVSTVHAILRRHGALPGRSKAAAVPARGRWARERPNELWQMDFKGHFALAHGGRCHPLVLLDDCSRFCLGIFACADERTHTVKRALTWVFREHGLPQAMLMDNGSPWGNTREQVYTPLGVWLLALDVAVLHGRPRHPQTQGKLERLNRTLDEEVLQGHPSGFAGQTEVQTALDEFRCRYNGVRPHEALALETPARRYAPSPRAFPEELPRIEYEAADTVRRVQQGGWVSYQGREYRLPKAFRGHPVALRATEAEPEIAVYFGPHRIMTLDPQSGKARPVLT